MQFFEVITIILSSKSIVAVIPAYNEENLIKKTLHSVPEYIDRIYVIDDCSKDRTVNLIEEEKDDRIVLIKHKNNQGVGGAIVSGYKAALDDNMDIAVVLAGDNQMDPQYIPKLCKPIIEGIVDYTKGNRLSNPANWKGMSKWRLFGNLILNFLNKIVSGYWSVSDPQNGYTAISKSALQKLDLEKIYKRYAFENDLLVCLNKKNLKVLSVPIPARYGKEKSNIKYPAFIINISFFFIRAFIQRIYEKYIKNFHPIGYILFFGIGLGIIGFMSFSFNLLSISSFISLEIVSFLCLISAFTYEYIIDKRNTEKIAKILKITLDSQ